MRLQHSTTPYQNIPIRLSNLTKQYVLLCHFLSRSRMSTQFCQWTKQRLLEQACLFPTSLLISMKWQIVPEFGLGSGPVQYLTIEVNLIIRVTQRVTYITMVSLRSQHLTIWHQNFAEAVLLNYSLLPNCSTGALIRQILKSTSCHPIHTNIFWKITSCLLFPPLFFEKEHHALYSHHFLWHWYSMSKILLYIPTSIFEKSTPC